MRASLSQMVMQKDTRIYPGSGKRRPYVQWGERVCIILHLSACTGVNTSVVWSIEVLLRMDMALRDVLPPVRSWASPFIAPRRDLGYKYRRQSRG